MNQSEQIIKSIVPTKCPSCGTTVLIEFNSIPPQLNAVMTIEEARGAKELVKTKVAEIKDLDADLKTSVFEWVDQDSTIFGPSEVDSIVQSVIQNNDTLKKNPAK